MSAKYQFGHAMLASFGTLHDPTSPHCPADRRLALTAVEAHGRASRSPRTATAAGTAAAVAAVTAMAAAEEATTAARVATTVAEAAAMTAVRPGPRRRRRRRPRPRSRGVDDEAAAKTGWGSTSSESAREAVSQGWALRLEHRSSRPSRKQSRARCWRWTCARSWTGEWRYEFLILPGIAATRRSSSMPVATRSSRSGDVDEGPSRGG